MKLNSISALLLGFVTLVSCAQNEGSHSSDSAETGTGNLGPVVDNKAEPHRYGGWYCPDNLGFTPVDIQKFAEVPAIANRLPTEEELHNNMSLINVDTEKYPDARALEMDLPRVARIHSERSGMDELIIVIQAIVVQEDTVLGWRFMNGGNGSGWFTDVQFLTDEEIAGMGSQPFFYSNSTLNARSAAIWNALTKTEYFEQLGKKFNESAFFSSDWNPDAQAHLNLDTKEEKATGYVGMVFGNYYLHIDYNRNGSHYSEKILIMENQEDNTTEFFFASGPYPKGFDQQRSTWESWVEEVIKVSEAG